MTEELRQNLLRQYYHIMNESYTPQKIKSMQLDFYKIANISIDEKRCAEVSYSSGVSYEYIHQCTFAAPDNCNRLLCEVRETHDADSVIARLKKNYDLCDWQFMKSNMCNNVQGIDAEYKTTDTTNLNILCPMIERNREIIINILNQEGYYLAQEFNTVSDDKSDVKWVFLCFAPNNSVTASSDIHKRKYLYHITVPKKFTTIQQVGLTPHSSVNIFKYPERVYLWVENDPAVLCNFAYSQYKYFNTPNLLILRIDVSKIPDSIEFFYDPLQNGAVYTESNIPSNAIIPYAVVKCDENGYDVEPFEIITK